MTRRTGSPRVGRIPGAIGRAAMDARNLGWWAPVRSVHEVARRTGALDLVVRASAARQPDGELAEILAAPTHIPAAAADRTLAAANEIASGTVEIFGRKLDVGSKPDWHAFMERPGSWPRLPAGKMPLRGPRLASDPKWAWELARHRHLVTVARAAHLRPDDPHWAEVLTAQLVSWMDENPPGIGIHWTSGLELCLRGIAWAQILGLAGSQLDSAVRIEMGRHLWRAMGCLAAELPLARSSMTNNHLLAASLGLDVHGRMFANSTAGRRLAAMGRGLFDRQLVRQYDLDGSGRPRRGGATIEDSVGYDRFCLELLATRLMLADPGDPSLDLVRSCLFEGAAHLARLGATAGAVPAFGDSDEGRALASSGASSPPMATLALVAGLLGTGASATERETFDEAAWYLETGEPVTLPEAERDGRDTGGGIARGTRGPIVAWLKCDGGGWHGHGDLGSVAVTVNEDWVVSDPGTGSYNPDAALRRHFQSTSAHNCLLLEDEDQRNPYRTFRFRHSPRGRIGDPIQLGDSLVLWGWHDAYRRLEPPRRVVRLVAIQSDALCVIDHVEGGSPVNWEMRLTIPHPAAIEPGRPHLAQSDPPLFFPPDARVTASDEGTTWSPRYGELQPATVVELSGSATSVAWGLGEPGSLWEPTPYGATRQSVEIHVLWLNDEVHIEVVESERRGGEPGDAAT